MYKEFFTTYNMTDTPDIIPNDYVPSIKQTEDDKLYDVSNPSSLISDMKTPIFE